MKLEVIKGMCDMNNKKINVCILGGGNIGTLLLGDLGLNEDISLRLFTSRPNEWSKSIQVYNKKNELQYTGQVDIISNNPCDVITDSQIIISTIPSYVFPKVIKKIEPFIKKGTLIGLMPGSGGGEFFCKRLIEKGCILFGFERVHSIARIKKYGESVYNLGKKQELHIASLPTGETKRICCLMERIMKVKCTPLPNFLNVTLTPSNPILHTTRIYSILCNYTEDTYYNDYIKFYEDWNDEASEILFLCDNELQEICKKINKLDLSGVKSLRDYYNSETIEKMTKKIKSIEAFKGINLPMIKSEKGYIPDFNSRYFLEDFSFGLCIIKGFAEIVNIHTPNIDKILKWFEKIMNVEFFSDNKFQGNDLKELPLARNYKLNNINDIINYYR